VPIIIRDFLTSVRSQLVSCLLLQIY